MNRLETARMGSVLWENGLAAPQWGVVIGASLVAAATDLASRRIHNLLTGPLVLSGLVFSGFFGGAGGVLESLAACALLALPYVVLFVYAGGGAGDAKLMGGIGAWLGLAHGAVVLGCVAGAGVVLAVIWSLAGRRLNAVITNIVYITITCVAAVVARTSLTGALASAPADTEVQRMPYGLAICAGVLIGLGGVLLWGA